MKDRPRAAIVLLGALIGLWGLRWGLPDRARLALILPPGLDGPAFHERLASSWSKMHERLGANLMINPESYATFTGVQRVKAGWTEPPDLLLNSLRSFYVRSEYEDEQSALLALSRMRPRQLNFNPHLFTYGGAYLYPLGAWEGFGAVFGAVKLHTGLAPYLAEPAKMGQLYYWGRVLSAFAFIGCALLLLRLGRAGLGDGTGPVAAFLFLFMPAAIVHAHSLKNHIVWTFFALLTLERSQAVLARGGLKEYALAGAAAGLTVGSFLMGWPATAFVALAAWLSWRGGQSTAAEAARGTALAAVCAVVAFFVTNPYWLLSMGEAVAEMKALSGNSYFDWRSPAIFLVKAMPRAITWPVALLLFAGVIVAARRGRRDPSLLLVLGAFVAGLTFSFASPDVLTAFGARYGLGWVAIGLLLAARAATEAWRAARPGLRPALGAVFALVALHLSLTGATYAHSFGLAAGARSNHILAGAWIEKNIPAGEPIGLLRLPQPSNAPFFRYDRYELVFIEPSLFPVLPAGQLPRYLALTAPIHDDRPAMEPNLSRYESLAVFERARLVPWIAVDPVSSNANPRIEIYRLIQ